jgi:hypothetical protein
LERIEQLLAQQAGPAGAVRSDGLVATANGKLAHRATCGLVAGRDVTPLTAEEAHAREPCQVCDPF